MWSFRSITPRTTRVNLQRNLCIHFQNGVHTKLVVDAQTRIENVMPLAGLDSNYSVMSRLVRKKILTGRGVDGFVDSTIRSFADGRDDSEVIKWTLCTVTISGFVGPVCPQHLTVDTTYTDVTLSSSHNAMHRARHFHFIDVYCDWLACYNSEWFCVLILTKIILCALL